MATSLLLQHIHALASPRFSLSPLPSTLAPGAVVDVVMRGSVEAGDRVAEQFVVSVLGGNHITIQCSAEATAPKAIRTGRGGRRCGTR